MKWLSESDISTVDEIKYCKDKIAEANKQIKDIEFQKELYTNRILSDIRKFFPIINPDRLHMLWHKFNSEDKGEDYDKCYASVCAVIESNIIADTPCKHKKRTLISNIIACGYGPYGYQLSFICNNIEFILFVPVNKAIDVQNLYYAHEGKYALYYRKSECHISCIEESYELSDLKDAFNDFIVNKKDKPNNDQK